MRALRAVAADQSWLYERDSPRYVCAARSPSRAAAAPIRSMTSTSRTSPCSPANGIERGVLRPRPTGYRTVMPFEWTAQTYDALPLPHVAWGRRVLDRMRLTGTERVLDAGCGTGRDAAALLERLPGIDLVGVDASSQMIEVARERLGDRGTLVV